MRLGGEGDIDIGIENLNYLVKATVVATAAGQGGKELVDLKGLTIPVKLTGPFTAPQYKIDFSGIAAGAAKAVVEGKTEEIKSEKRRSKCRTSSKGSLGADLARKSRPARASARGAGLLRARSCNGRKKHGRHDLPWQNTRDAYRIWLSEIMLQQTQVTTVIPYYQRFLARFPDVESLAAAAQDDVLTLWSGLGYYSRARNLHRAAQQVIARHGAHVPDDFDALLALPGIGRSTAAAISVFAFGARHAILDGNVKRLFARRFGIAGYPGDARVAAVLWRETERQLPSRDIESYTQGLMDLGATLCTRTKPRCDACPVAADCVSLKTNAIKNFPRRARAKSCRNDTRGCSSSGCTQTEVLLERRAPTGHLGRTVEPARSGGGRRYSRAVRAALRRARRVTSGDAGARARVHAFQAGHRASAPDRQSCFAACSGTGCDLAVAGRCAGRGNTGCRSNAS